MSAPGADHEAEQRHASWLELFFDLVVVAGIGLLGHLLRDEDTAGGLALYLIAFGAFWLAWACSTTYGNIAGEATQPGPMLAGMAALAVMAAAVPGIHDEHAQVFAVSYVVARVIASQPFGRTTIVLDLPIVGLLGGVLPWVVSWWVTGTARYVLWSIGLALDLVLLLMVSETGLVEGSQRRLDRLQAEVAREHPRFGRGRREVPARITPLSADAPHLGERLGLFVIIVLGEGLVLLISAASEITWDAALVAAGAGGFTLIVALWAVGVRYGYAGLALVPSGTGIADAPPGRLEGPGRAGRIWCRCQAEHRGCR